MTLRAIDLFAGAGGFSEGAQLAGLDVVWAANHWETAVRAHAANHPGVAHECQDLQQANFCAVPEHDVLLASPACQGHANARGKERPHHDAARATAWAVVSCAEVHRPPTVIVENVAEFAGWALYPAWQHALKALGYTMTENIMDAADAGVPQHRRRLFVVATLDGARRIAPPSEAHVPVAHVLDFAEGSWSPIDKPGRAEATLRRVENGRAACGSTFVMPYYGQGSGLTGRSIDRPLGTVTTRDRWALVQDDMMRMLTVNEYKAAMGFRKSYDLQANRRTSIHLLGNAVPPPLAAHVIREAVAA